MKDKRDIEILIARAADGTLEPHEAEILLAACKGDARLLAGLRDQIAMERILALDGGRRQIPEGFTEEILTKISGRGNAGSGFTPRVLQGLSGKPVPLLRNIAALAALIAISVGAWMFWKADSVPPVVATVTGMEAAADFGTSREFSQGQSLVFESGFVRLRFGKGAVLILEGPADLEFAGDNGAILKRGSASVRVPDSATGFTLVGPDAKVIDVSTEFAMKVSPNSPTEVHVLDGLILTNTTRDPVKSEMRTNQAIEVIDGNARKIPARPARFLNELPERKAGSPGFLHWSFDDRVGLLAPNIGPGIDGFENPAHLRSATPGGREPAHVEGVFGPGLFLDGENSYVETGFPGIGGDDARSVAMWVKLPADWHTQNGYAMASWGSFNAEGAAWQLSVNPGDYGGEIGRLRVGTYMDYVVGETDLRDGKWHHIAAVMYGGKGARAATHVLLYVDGNLENTETKSTRSIRTDIHSPNSVDLQLGRNLATLASDEEQKLFFRGWLDEVVVVNAALSQEQVRSLMKHNRFE